MPWGAGLCVTLKIACHFMELVERLGAKALGPRGRQNLYRGDDDLFSWASVFGGQGFGVFPELRVTHLIPAERLSRRYLLRFVHDHRFSAGVLNYLLSADEPKGMDLFCIAHVILHGVRNGRFAMQCKWAAARGTDKAKRYIVERELRPVELKKPKAAHANQGCD